MTHSVTAADPTPRATPRSWLRDGALLLLKRAADELGIPVRAWILTKRLTRERRQHENDFDLTDDMRLALALNEDALRESHRFELARREQLQRRAQSYMVAVAVAVSFTLTILAASRSATDFQLRVGGRVALFAVLYYLMLCGLTALHVIAPSPAFDFPLQQCVAMHEAGLDAKPCLIKSTYLNQNLVLALAAWSDVSRTALRNALVIIAALLAMLIVDEKSSFVFEARNGAPQVTLSDVRPRAHPVGSRVAEVCSEDRVPDEELTCR